ncbi:MAG: (Fe-S)-binding protein [Candidatus Bathyarchaeota archaeon]|jgi:Fe-S oxidoreductase
METTVQGFIDEFDLLECIQCGVCTGGCPVSIKSGLNIRMLMGDLKFIEEVEIPSEDVLWSCTTCSACEARCPKELVPFEVIIGMRGITVEEGRIAPTVRDALESVFKHGNPWDRARGKRSEWAEGLDLPVFTGEEDLLYYVGCTPAYDPRCQETARSLVVVFRAAGVNFGTLENEESCCGDPVYGMGEKGLFELLVEDNMVLFKERGVERMVTTSPHCFNAFKNKYGETGIEVRHYTQLLAELIDEGKLEFTKGFERTVTYHDPCFLGRQNEVYDEPRRVLEAVPGLEFMEFDRSRERSVCCEGGGGRMWMDVAGERLAESRVRDAVDMGAEVIATACPFCTSTLEDAVLVTGLEDSVEIMDVAEIVSKIL